MSDPDDSYIGKARTQFIKIDREWIGLVLIAVLFWEVYDIWPDSDSEVGLEHVTTFLHFMESHPQLLLVLGGWATAVTLKLIERGSK